MREYRIPSPSFDGVPDDLADYDGSCWPDGGLCCPDDSLDTVMKYVPIVVDEGFLEDLAIAAGSPLRQKARLPAGRGGEVIESKGAPGVDADAGGDVDMGFGDRDARPDGAPPLPARAALLATSGSLATPGLPTTWESESPAPVCDPLQDLVVPRKKRRHVPAKRRKRLWSLMDIPSGNDDGEDSRGGNVDGVGGARQRPVARPRNRQAQRVCSHCDISKTPQWRAGPEGPGTLCNACGIRFALNRLFPEYRPSTSPSFRGGEHSNRHRKVVKLREQKAEGEKVFKAGSAKPWRVHGCL